MSTAGKIGLGLGIVGVVAAIGVAVVKLVNGKNGKNVTAAADANAYCSDDEVQTVEGWETSRPTESL